MDADKMEKKTKLKRRGEVEIPTILGKLLCLPAPGGGAAAAFAVWTLSSPDQPEDGPQLYVLLFGFYCAHLIAALDDVGVHVSSVIRLCSEDVDQEVRSEDEASSQAPGGRCPRSPTRSCSGRFTIFLASPRNKLGPGPEVEPVLVRAAACFE